MNYEECFEQGCVNFDKNNFSTALNYFELALQKEPLSIGSLYNLALCFYELGEYEKSITVSNKVIELSENYLVIEAIFNRGNCYQKTLQFEKAVQDFSQIISINDKNSSAYFNRANAYLKLGKIDKANKDRLIVKRLENTNDITQYYKPPSHTEIDDNILDKFNYTKDNLEKNNPYNEALKHFERGNNYVKIREFSKAIEHFQKAINHYPLEFYEEAQFNLIQCLIDSDSAPELIDKEVTFYISHNKDNEIINQYKKQGFGNV